MAGLLIAGTCSDAGKTTVVTGLCRALARRGLDVAPFKAQNMSNNAMVAADGEIGRAQWIQALAARAEPTTAMNPVLLKPGADTVSHVVVRGRPAGEITGANWRHRQRELVVDAYRAFAELSSRHDLVIAEGAGSLAEINLRDTDYVNLGLAQEFDLPVVVVGDIDRGGVFASLFGSLAVLDRADQDRVAGFVINRFRGTRALLDPGIERLRELTGRPTFGVLPWVGELWLDSEDTLIERPAPSQSSRPLRVAVTRLPRLSNATDLDALALEPDVELRYVTDPQELLDSDLVVIPGSRATRADLAWLQASGLAAGIVSFANQGGAVLGICGGAQMLTESIRDPDGIEGEPMPETSALGLLRGVTTFGPDKIVRTVRDGADGATVTGYEIRHGEITWDPSLDTFPGGAARGRITATTWHGLFENDRFREGFLAQLADHRGTPRAPSQVSFPAARERRLERLADLVEEHLDLDQLIDLARADTGRGRPVLVSRLESPD